MKSKKIIINVVIILATILVVYGSGELMKLRTEWSSESFIYGCLSIVAGGFIVGAAYSLLIEPKNKGEEK